MGNCNARSVSSSSELQVGASQRHPSLMSLPMRTNMKFGWRPDMPDHRDLRVTFDKVDAPSHITKKSEGEKEIIDLRPMNGGFPIFDQGHLGSCTANALAAGFHFTLHKMQVENHKDFADFTPSRLFIYYNERLVEGSVNQDAGAMIRDGIKVMSKVGVCPESIWKYDDGPDFFKQQPDDKSYELAQKCRVMGYARVAQDLSQFKACLKNGYPFVFGFAVLSSFQTAEVARTGKMVMPQATDQQLGGHAVCAVGYDDFQQCFIVRNSWGEAWGDKGYFYMPYEYMCHPALASDFWAINWVEGFKNTSSISESGKLQIGGAPRHPNVVSLPMRTNMKFGWRPDMPDHRDLHVTFGKVDAPSHIKKKAEGTKEIVDLRPMNGGFPIFDQGHLGSCTANALAAAFHFTLHKMQVENHKDFADFTPSRLFIYYNERLVEGSVNQDAGAMLRDGIKTMSKVGVCPESIWKYDDQHDFFKQQPNDKAYELAQKCKVIGYARVAQDLSQFKMCIKSGYPFVFGFAVLSSFQTAEVARTGKMVMPQATDQQLGGHAVCAVGYDDFQQCFIVRNSWGEGWGDKGYFYMPYEYMCHPALAHDFWAINWVEGFKNTRKGELTMPKNPLVSSLPTRSIQKFGWKPDMPDHRDLHVTFPKVEAPTKIKKKAEGQKETVDLRPMNGGFPIFDQGHLGSCTANALAAAFHFTLHKMEVENHKDFSDFTPSRLFIYYNERLVEGSVNQDAGAMIRDGIKTMSKVGVCPESVWKYDDGPSFFKQEPNQQAYEIAQKCRVMGYARVAQDLSQMKMCIKSGYPFVFGFAVLSSFQTAEVARTGKMVMPQATDQQLGGHAVCAVGYDDFQQCFIVRNSWGEGWGDKGYFYMPYEYICHPSLASDFWAINWVEGFKNASTKPAKK